MLNERGFDVEGKPSCNAHVATCMHRMVHLVMCTQLNVCCGMLFLMCLCSTGMTKAELEAMIEEFTAGSRCMVVQWVHQDAGWCCKLG